MTILHVTNGDSAAEGLRWSGIAGKHDTVLPWRDVLHDGPVPSDADRTAFRDVRSRFLAERHWSTVDEVRHDLQQRDARLDAHHDAVVLWFEPDLYDQLQLIQVLARIGERPPNNDVLLPESVSIVPADCMLGSLDPAGFAPLFAHRRPVRRHDFERATAAWHAFTASTPERFVEVMHREIDGADVNAWPRSYADDAEECLPYLGHALHRQFVEYPDRVTGLSRSEGQIGRCLDAGPMPVGTLFHVAHHGHETWPWLGDWSFAWYVERLRTAAKPLVEFTAAALKAPEQHVPPPPAYWQQSLALTAFGKSVIAGNADAIAENGIDRWIGGTHLTTRNHWRRDTERLTSYSGPTTS